MGQKRETGLASSALRFLEPASWWSLRASVLLSSSFKYYIISLIFSCNILLYFLSIELERTWGNAPLHIHITLTVTFTHHSLIVSPFCFILIISCLCLHNCICTTNTHSSFFFSSFPHSIFSFSLFLSLPICLAVVFYRTCGCMVVWVGLVCVCVLLSLCV